VAPPTILMTGWSPFQSIQRALGKEELPETRVLVGLIQWQFDVVGSEITDSPPSDWNGSSSYIIQNQRPRRIHVVGDRDRELCLAPLESREARGDSLVDFSKRCLERTDDLLVTERTATQQTIEDTWFGFGFLAIVGYLVVGFRLDRLAFWVGIPALAALIVSVYWVRARRGGLEVARWTKQAASLLVVLLTAIGIPAATMWFGAGLNDAWADAGSPAELFSSPDVLGRALQLLFISAASLLPALMYFLFDREQLGTLRDRFLQQVFRLDPSLTRMNDLRAKYGSQVDEVYGSDRASRARLLGGRLSPIFVATLLITLGWTLTLLNPEVRPNGEGGVRIVDLFQPERNVVTFAFLGAYFFAVQLVLRGYMRGDLRAKSYSHISVRILIVVILAWMLQEVFGSENTGLLILVFLAGVVPETALRWIREVPRRLGLSLRGLAILDELSPLTTLEGIDLYDRTRLMDEGVTNVEALAHHDFVELMLRTRIPAPRLVDWLDQAILYLHTRSRTDSEEADADRKGAKGLWGQLHGHGVRTASDLRRVAEDKSYEQITRDPSGFGSKLSVVLATMADDEWLEYVLHWRRQLDLGKTTIELDARHPVPTAESSE
jgi:hypothetical protein